ncbi:hypothetical protein V7759_20960 [Bacillus sp. H7(2023)]
MDELKVSGTVTISYVVDIDAEDISEDAMDMYNSDVLIADAIEEKYNVIVNGDVFVKRTEK